MVEDLKAAYADQISRAGWMDEATRKAALEKLAAMQVRVGHPEHYIDYTSLPVSRTDLLANITASQDFAWRRKLAQLGKRQDRGAWFLFPDRQCLQRPQSQSGDFRGSHSAAALLRRGCRSCGELRRGWSHYRA
jgi:hypothetical protein